MNIQNRLQKGEFVVLAEMNTPKGIDISQFMTNVRRLKDRINGIIVPDMDNGVMRMSALAGGALVQQQGIESIITVYGRDRNRMALQGDLLAAYVLGVQGLVVVKGEGIAQCDNREARAVDDLDELALISAIQSLQKGQDLGGWDLSGSPSFLVGCSIGSYKDEAGLEQQLVLAKAKIEAGARFVITPPVYDLAHFEQFMQKAVSLKAPIIPSVFLIKSVAVARYIAANEPGAVIPEDLFRRFRTSPDRETEGEKIAGETVARVRKMAQGVLLQTMGWEHRIPAILETAGL